LSCEIGGGGESDSLCEDDVTEIDVLVGVAEGAAAAGDEGLLEDDEVLDDCGKAGMMMMMMMMMM